MRNLHLTTHASDMHFARKRDYIFGLLAFYERGQHAFWAEAFVAAYRQTAPRCAELLGYVQGGGVLGTLT